MDNKLFIGVLSAAIIGLLSWNMKTTYDLVLKVQRLEIILLEDALKK